MDNPIGTINKLMSADISIREYMESMEFLVDRTPESVDYTTVVNDGFSMLVKLIESQGLNFHNVGGIGELLDNHYQAEHLITIYKRFSVEPLLGILSDDRPLLKIIRNLLDSSVSDSELIVFILETFSNVNYSPDSTDCFVFLQDKIISTEIYATALREGITEILDQPESQVINQEAISKFFKDVLAEKAEFKSIINKLKITYELDSVISEFRDDIVKGNMSYLANLYQQGDTESIKLIIDGLRKTHINYIDRVIALNSDVTTSHIITMLCTELSNQKLFRIEPDFTKFSLIREDIDEILINIANAKGV